MTRRIAFPLSSPVARAAHVPTRYRSSVELNDSIWPNVERSARFLAQCVANGQTVYGEQDCFSMLARD